MTETTTETLVRWLLVVPALACVATAGIAATAWAAAHVWVDVLAVMGGCS